MKFTSTFLFLVLIWSFVSCANSDSSNSPSLNQISSVSQIPDNPNAKRINEAPDKATALQEEVYQKVIPKEKPSSLKALEGVYTEGGHDESWLLVLKSNKNKLKATLFEIKGMLPHDGSAFSKKEFQNSIIEQITLNSFEVNLSNLSFQSDLGPGDLTGNLIVFLRYYDIHDKPLSLYRDPEFDVLLKE